VSDAWLRDWLARSVELVEKYKPELMYFDGGNGQPAFRASMTEFTAFYDNFAVSHHIDGVITLKDYAMEWTAGARDFEQSLRTDIDPRPWQTDTSISNLSWGYMEHDQFKTPEFLVHQLVDIVSKNGNLLLSIGRGRMGQFPMKCEPSCWIWARGLIAMARPSMGPSRGSSPAKGRRK